MDHCTRVVDTTVLSDLYWRICPTQICEVGTGFEPVYTALQAVASPLGHPTEAGRPSGDGACIERTTGFEPATLTLAR